MNAIVFAGPSISREAVEALQGVEWRPPVSQGDVYRASQSSPVAIAIIDGYFEGVPSVWHKEILWAMSRGIHVFGAASMGALRAAELHQFGMRGVGEIFENFRNGIFEDDDEVAVLHGPAEMGYLPLSLPMVNARATIECALENSIINKTVAEKITEIAKSVFYQNRHWADIIESANKMEIDHVTLSEFERWLPTGERDLKRRDAEVLLDELRIFLATDVEPFHCEYTFEWTVMWDNVVAGQTDQSAKDNGAVDVTVDQWVLNELRLEPKKYRQINLRVRLRQLALREAGRKRIEIDPAQTRKQLQHLRGSQKLYSRVQLDAWIEDVGWQPATLQHALEVEQRCNAVIDRLGVADEGFFLDELRLEGDYIALKQRAEMKRSTIESASAKAPVSPPQLLAWYFEERLGRPIPADLDDYLLQIGISKRENFYRLLQKEYLYAVAIASESQ